MNRLYSRYPNKKTRGWPSVICHMQVHHNLIYNYLNISFKKTYSIRTEMQHYNFTSVKLPPMAVYYTDTPCKYRFIHAVLCVYSSPYKSMFHHCYHISCYQLLWDHNCHISDTRDSYNNPQHICYTSFQYGTVYSCTVLC